jgi:hypothetical protein
VIDRRNRPGIVNAPEGAIVTLEVTVDQHQPARPDAAMFRIAFSLMTTPAKSR